MFKDNMPAAQNEFDSIMHISREIEELSSQENPYTSLTKDVSRINPKMCKSINPLRPNNDLSQASHCNIKVYQLVRS